MSDKKTFVIPDDTFPLTFDKAVKLHRDYWKFIAENELDYKPEITYSNGVSAEVFSNCALCDYAVEQVKSRAESRCGYCPADVTCYNPLHCLDGRYFEWEGTRRVEAALAIANVPMKSKEN